MIENTSGLRFEELIPSDQGLTFYYTSDVFKTAKVNFGNPQYITLGITTIDGVFTNLGLLLSDQCQHFIEAETYDGEDTSICREHQVIAGSLPAQFHYALQFVSRNSYVDAHFNSIMQVPSEPYKFPPIAVREALLNALMHRDYSLPHATRLKIFSNRLELVSFGGLLPELPMEKVGCGLSACRNENLAWVFRRVKWAEIYGTGIPKIFKEYDNYASKPQIVSNADTFSITLPSIIPPDSAVHTDLFA